MAVVWNGYETGKKIYKTHPDGLPAQYNAFRQVLSQWGNAKIDSGIESTIPKFDYLTFPNSGTSDTSTLLTETTPP